MNPSKRSLFVPLIGLLLLTGCSLTEQVNNAVRDSNAVLLEASLGATGLPLTPEAQVDSLFDWHTAIERIYAFTEAHPEETALNHTLYLRAAIILIGAGQYNRARAAFNQIENRDLLKNVRDRVLYDLRDDLIWWYDVSRKSAFGRAERSRAGAAMLHLCTVANGIAGPENQDVSRFLEEWRVLIALRWARSLSSPASIRPIYADALPRYAAQFDATARRAIQTWALTPDQTTATLRDLRWYDFVPEAFARAEAKWALANQSNPDSSAFTPAWVTCISEGDCAGADLEDEMTAEPACQSILE